MDGCMYVIAVHNFGRAILLWGTSKEKKKKSKTCSGIHCHSIAVLDYVFPATSKDLRVPVPVKTQVCIAHLEVSNYNHKQMSKEVEGESKCVWCSPGMLPILCQLVQSIQFVQQSSSCFTCRNTLWYQPVLGEWQLLTLHEGRCPVAAPSCAHCHTKLALGLILSSFCFSW